MSQSELFVGPDYQNEYLSAIVKYYGNLVADNYLKYMAYLSGFSDWRARA